MYFFVLKYLRNFVLKYLRNSTFLLKYLRSGPPPLTPGGVRYGDPKITLFLENLSPMVEGYVQELRDIEKSLSQRNSQEEGIV